MKELGNIYLSWRVGAGHRRYIVGVIKNNASKGIRFSYIKQGVEEAQKAGFAPYTEFPELHKEYSEDVLEVFGQRLIKSERSDINTFYDFWEIKPRYRSNKYYLLAHTQGLLPTDNFEFLADYYPVKNLCFLTDLAGLTSKKLPAESLKEGELLNFKFEPDNPHDKMAVMVYKNNTHIGYIKKIHSRVFHKNGGGKLQLAAKGIDQNGILKKVFVKVFF